MLRNVATMAFVGLLVCLGAAHAAPTAKKQPDTSMIRCTRMMERGVAVNRDTGERRFYVAFKNNCPFRVKILAWTVNGRPLSKVAAPNERITIDCYDKSRPYCVGFTTGGYAVGRATPGE